ncbi:MAG: DUF1549 domain-containing protein, partial [Planctomycetaceae bacterium]|nr:DUF1549 domain-containing protein [Planctomycetaceae bacterium]
MIFRQLNSLFCLLAICGWVLVPQGLSDERTDAVPSSTVDSSPSGNKAARLFGQDVYPVLRSACFECHGAAKQAGELRLDSADYLRDSGMVISGQPDDSELLRRVQLPAEDPERMPATGDPLKPREIAALRDWIAAGAVWPEDFEIPVHWSYLPPRRSPLPEAPAEWDVKNAVDLFLFDRLRQEQMHPSPPAEPAILLRRLTLDLIGLPPTPQEVAAFVADPSESHYQAIVDELLHRPQFGERWARPWLDLARYADSHGFQRDDLRDIWPYRDWVIQALNADLPFDQFTIEQLAG